MSNVRVFRFKNSSTAALVMQRIIEPMRREKDDYIILFVPLRRAHPKTQALCGYVPVSKDEVYELDHVERIVADKLVSMEQCKIELLLLMGCHSYHLAKVFQPFIRNIICVHPHCKIDDDYCVRFSRFFYRRLAKGDIVEEAFYGALQQLEDRDALSGRVSDCMMVLYARTLSFC